MDDIRKGICPLCSHDQIIEAWPEDHTDMGGRGGMNLSVAERTTWTGPKLFGTLCAYVCRQCGFTQWFTLHPSQIPIGAECRTTLIQGQR